MTNVLAKGMNKLVEMLYVFGVVIGLSLVFVYPVFGGLLLVIAFLAGHILRGKQVQQKDVKDEQEVYAPVVKNCKYVKTKKAA